MKEDQPSPIGSWKSRRKVMWTILLFSMATIAYSLSGMAPEQIAATAVTMGFGAITTILVSYVFGAAWEDINARKDTK